jgi:lichenan operon transcriptional antiterminator
MAYQMAHVTSSVLREYYKKDIPEEEIGYFALIFALALEKGKTDCRYDILVVCGTGKGTSRLLKYKYEQEFSDYLKNIYVCDLLGLEEFDVSRVDYIFTTVPITREVAVPIIEVGMFLGTDDIQKITGLLRYGSNGGMIRRYYGEKRFIRDVPAGTKEEILAYLCGIIRRQEQIDPDFYELVLEREAYAQMDYGNYIAIPHPNRIASQESFAYVAVLEKPVIWNNQPVQVVLLVSIGRKEDRDMQRFYETTARFALNTEAVAAVIRNPEYEVFIEMLQR